MLHRIGAVVVVGAFATLRAQTALADESSVERADALFQEGRAAVREGNWERGCPKFEESLKLDPAPGTRINFGECEERSGHLVAAFQLYDQASRELPADDRRLPLAKQRAAAVDARIPRLVVPANVHARIDGSTGFQTGELRLDPGRHQVVVVSGGREQTMIVALVEKERRTLDPDAPTANGSAEPATPTRRIVGYAVGGVGLASLATGLVFGGLVLHDKTVIDGNCDASNACSQDGLDAKSEGKVFSTVSTIAVGAGILALAAGIYLVVTAPRSSAPRIGSGVLNVRF